LLGIASKHFVPRGTTSATVMSRADVARRQLRACSACAGDYEDPECTAASEIGDEDNEDAAAANAEDAARSVPRDGFPALER
jgi:hypothetical protein